MIDTIVTARSGGNALLASTTKTRLVLKGFNPDKFTATSPDDPETMRKLANIAKEMGVDLGSF